MITWFSPMDWKARTFWKCAKCLSVSLCFWVNWKLMHSMETGILHKFSCSHTNTATEVFSWAIVFCCLTYTQAWTVSSCCVRKRQWRLRNICWSRWRWGSGSPCGPPGFLSGRGCTVQLHHHLVCTDGTLSNFNNGHLAIETV